jgi:hypothetical protein
MAHHPLHLVLVAHLGALRPPRALPGGDQVTPDQTVSGWLTEKRKSADFGNPPEPQLVDCLTNDAWLDGYECGQRSRPTDEEIQAWGQEIRENAYRRGLHDGWGELIDAHQQWAHLLAVMNRHQLDRDNSTSYIPRRVSA